MRTSHRHKFVFLSKPRTGSTSVRRMLNQYSDVICDRRGQPESGFHPHLNWEAATELFVEKGWDFSSYFSFATLRNPWGLTVSFYSFFKPDAVGRYNFMSNYDETTSMPFTEWVQAGRTWNIAKKSWRKDISGFGIEAFAFDSEGKQRVDEIFPIEEIDGLAEVISEIVQEKILPKHVNKSDRASDYRKYYDLESRDRVAQLFTKDIEIGGYDF